MQEDIAGLFDPMPPIFHTASMYTENVPAVVSARNTLSEKTHLISGPEHKTSRVKEPVSLKPYQVRKLTKKTSAIADVLQLQARIYDYIRYGNFRDSVGLKCTKTLNGVNYASTAFGVSGVVTNIGKRLWDEHFAKHLRDSIESMGHDDFESAYETRMKLWVHGEERFIGSSSDIVCTIGKNNSENNDKITVLYKFGRKNYNHGAFVSVTLIPFLNRNSSVTLEFSDIDCPEPSLSQNTDILTALWLLSSMEISKLDKPGLAVFSQINDILCEIHDTISKYEFLDNTIDPTCDDDLLLNMLRSYDEKHVNTQMDAIEFVKQSSVDESQQAFVKRSISRYQEKFNWSVQLRGGKAGWNIDNTPYFKIGNAAHYYRYSDNALPAVYAEEPRAYDSAISFMFNVLTISHLTIEQITAEIVNLNIFLGGLMRYTVFVDRVRNLYAPEILFGNL